MSTPIAAGPGQMHAGSTPTAGRTAAPRAPMLDGLRGWAVLGIMLHHYWPQATFKQSVAGIAMQGFFVMSGFLITDQLLRARAAILAGTELAWTTVRQFYWRRFLRLTPVFYAVIVIMWLLGVEEVRESFWWHILYVTNIYIVQIQTWPLWVSHLWSLAVEQQFYLVWPFVILFAPRWSLLPLLFITFVAGPIYRYEAWMMDVTWLTTYVVPFGYLDSIGIGGLLAFFSRPDTGYPSGRATLMRLCGWLGSLGLVASVVITATGYAMPHAAIWNTVEQMLWSMWMAWLIDRGWRNRGGRVMQTLLTPGPLLYIGTISYGMYILHPLMPGLVNYVLRMFSLGRLREGGLLFFVAGSVTVALSALSWHWFELPVSRLGRRASRA